MVEIEIALVGAAIAPFKMALAVLKPLVEIAFETATVRPDFNPVTVLLVIVPGALVLATLSDR